MFRKRVGKTEIREDIRSLYWQAKSARVSR